MMGRTERLNLLNASLNLLFIDNKKNEDVIDHRRIKSSTINSIKVVDSL